MERLEFSIIVIVPLMLLVIATGIDYCFWKKRTPKESDDNRYYPNLNLGKFMALSGICLAILYLIIIRLIPCLLKELPSGTDIWAHVILRLGILAGVISILVILAKAIRED